MTNQNKTLGAMALVPRDSIELAAECLERCQEQAFQSCECEECQQCGLMPDECTGTGCAKNCQCRTCDHCGNEAAIAELRTHLAPPTDAAYAPSESSGARMEMSDEWTQEVFSKRMLRKLEASAAKGRTGWQQCSHANLSRMLREHVEKGDPVDVANFCMFLDALGFSIAPAAQPCGDLLARFPEINFSNYEEQEVEALQAWAFEALDQIQASSLTDQQQRQAIELLNLADHALSHASLDAIGDVIEHTQDRRDHMRVQIIAFLKSLGTLQLAAPVEQDDESATCAKSQVELQPVEYQYRCRPAWCEEGRGWSDWARCAADSYADYNKAPLLHDWQYETRELHCNAEQPAPEALDPCSWTDRQVLDFLGVALRNVDLVGEVRLSEVRQGFEYMRDQGAKS